MIDRELFAQFEKFLESQGMKIVRENPSVSTQTEVNNLKVFRGRLINWQNLKFNFQTSISFDTITTKEEGEATTPVPTSKQEADATKTKEKIEVESSDLKPKEVEKKSYYSQIINETFRKQDTYVAGHFCNGTIEKKIKFYFQKTENDPKPKPRGVGPPKTGVAAGRGRGSGRRRDTSDEKPGKAVKSPEVIRKK